MSLHALKGRDFRLFTSLQMECHPEVNLIIGPNGSGKTSLLEAIYLLGRGKSFRTARRQSLWRRGCDRFSLQALLSGAFDRQIGLTLNASATSLSFRLQGKPVKVLSELLPLLPVQLLDPRTTPLVSGSPVDRRRFLDWGLFHVEPRFHAHWRTYQRALDQRNAALRAGSPPLMLVAWEQAMIEHGLVLNELRATYIEHLLPLLRPCLDKLDCPGELECRYQPGWPREKSLEEALVSSRSRDRAQGFSSIGPHRADLLIRVDGHAAFQQMSRGEEKRWTYALLMAQVIHLHQTTGQKPIVLVDDPVSELDESHWLRLLELLGELPAQRFVTLIDAAHARPPVDGALFHVEQGGLSRML